MGTSRDDCQIPGITTKIINLIKQIYKLYMYTQAHIGIRRGLLHAAVSMAC